MFHEKSLPGNIISEGAIEVPKKFYALPLYCKYNKSVLLGRKR